MWKLLKRIVVLITIFSIVILSLWSYYHYRAAKAVLTYESQIEQALRNHNSLSHVDIVLAMIYTETKGKSTDVMQSSESLTGEMNSITDSQSSIQQGISLLSNNLVLAEEKGVDSWTAVQAYNFGSAYIDFVAENGGQNTLALSKAYSKNVVAPSLGNTEGQTYFYHHPIALLSGGGQLYVNGGNIYYSREVAFNLYWIKLVRLITESLK